MMNYNTPLMVDPHQMIEISKYCTNLATMYKAADIAKARGEQYSDYDGFNTLCRYSFIFEMGRRQGIREERAKRHSRPQL